MLVGRPAGLVLRAHHSSSSSWSSFHLPCWAAFTVDVVDGMVAGRVAGRVVVEIAFGIAVADILGVVVA